MADLELDDIWICSINLCGKVAMDSIWSGIALFVILLLILTGRWSGILICSLILTAGMMQCGISSTIEIIPVLMMTWSIPVSAYFAALLI